MTKRSAYLLLWDDMQSHKALEKKSMQWSLSISGLAEQNQPLRSPWKWHKVPFKMEISSHPRFVQNPVSIFCPWCVLVAPNVACRKAEGSSRQLRSLFSPCRLSASRCSSLYSLSKAEHGQRFQCLQTWSRHLWCAVAGQKECAQSGPQEGGWTPKAEEEGRDLDLSLASATMGHC